MFDYCKICESLNTFAATNVAYRVTFKMEILNICKYVNTETKDILSEREENIVKKKKKKKYTPSNDVKTNVISQNEI